MTDVIFPSTQRLVVWAFIGVLMLAALALQFAGAPHAFAEGPADEEARESPLWSADMLVVEYTSVSIGAASADLFSNVGGSEGLHVKWLWSYIPDRDLRLAFEEAVPGAADLTLQVGDLRLAFPAGSSGETTFEWKDVDVDWEDGQILAVRIGPTSARSNSSATGLPSISGTAQVGEVLTADDSGIADEDGLTNVVFSYQWLRNDGTADTQIADAIGVAYTLVSDDEGKTIKVTVGFTDEAGNEEMRTSEPTNPVAAAVVAAALPTKPLNLTVTRGSQIEELDASWQTPASDGGSDITGYRVQWKEAADSWDTPEDVSEETVTGTTHTIHGLTEGVEYAVRVMATNQVGEGPASAEKTAVPRETRAPEVVTFRVDGATLRVVYDEALDEGSAPPADAFDVRVACRCDDMTWLDEEARRAVNLVSVDGDTVMLTLASPATADDYVVVSYNPPSDEASLRVQDVAGNAAAAIKRTQIINDTEEVSEDEAPAQNTSATGLPTIDGTSRVGETLTVDVTGIDDEDELTNVVFSYQWLADNADIAGATGATYTLVAADEGKAIKVTVSFTDAEGHEETRTSAPTAAVVNGDTCQEGPHAPAPVEMAVSAVPIVVESTAEEYFVLYVRHELDSDTAVELPVLVKKGEVGTTTLAENVAPLPMERYRVEKYLIADPGDVDLDCIDDITELTDPVGMNPVNPAAAIDLSDGAVVIPDQNTFEALTRIRGESIFKNRPFIKFVLFGMDTARPGVYFINTQTRARHVDFLNDLLDLGLVSPLRSSEVIAGQIGYEPELIAPDGSLGLYWYSIGQRIRSHYSFSQMTRVYALIAASMPLLEDNLVYYITGYTLQHHQPDLLSYRESRVNLVFDEDILPDVDFIPLNAGEGYGFLRVMSLEERPNPRDIVIYETLPNELSRVAGIITTVPQTPLSHVNLRAVLDDVPNAFIRDALDDADIDDLIGSYVHYTVTESGYTIRAATPEEADAHFSASRPAVEQVPERDLTVTQITALGDIEFDDWNAFGVKAANLAVLRTLGFPDGTVPDGYAVPFYFYDGFMKHNGFYDDIEKMLADQEFQTDYDVQEDELKKLRKKIKKGETPQWMTAVLEEMHAAFPESTSLRYRSSTNNEDLPGFSGAGLYDSKTQHPEETEEDGIAKSLKQVYASLWNFRAFTEREFHRIDHLAAAMGVLVHPNYSDELANGVAVSFDPFYGTGGYYVNSQVGEDLVTNPEAHSVPEEILLVPSGTYRVLATSNQVPRDQLLMSDAQMDQLRGHLKVIHDEFAELYGIEAGEPFAMEIEFKITSDNVLAIKQARPWVFSEAAVAEIPPDNSPATGAPAIYSTPQVGRPLLADTSGIADEDGLTNPAFTYQWVRNDGGADANIQGATGATYTLVSDDEGKTLKVIVSFTDDANNEESLTSEPTGPVVPDPGPLTVFKVVDTSSNPDTVLGTLEDGGALILGNPTGGEYGIRVDTDSNDDIHKVELALSGAKTGGKEEWVPPYSLYGDEGEGNLTGENLPAGAYELKATAYDDDGDVLGTLKVSFTVTAGQPAQQPTVVPNTSATGVPTIDGTAQVGQTLTAETSGIADEDGLTNVVFSYQWMADDTNIQDATGSSYTLTEDDEGKAITVTVSFTDAEGNPETLTSEPTGPVTPDPGPLTVFKVVDTSSNPDTVLGTLEDGGALTLEDPASGSYGIRVDTDSGHDDHGDIHKVELDLTGAKTEGKEEWVPPYSLYGDEGEGNLKGENLPAGAYELKATAYDDDGDVLGTLKVSFTVTAGQPAQQPTVVPNTSATGVPTISGTVQVGETLTAETSGIADEDGLTNVVFSYQWMADDTNIQDATGSSYTLTEVDEGKAITVTVSFTDAEGNPETLTSDPTGEVAAAPAQNIQATGVPTISGTLQVGETLTADTTGIADADGLTTVSYSYQWMADDTNIQGATGATYTLTEVDEGKAIKVLVSFTDDAGNVESRPSAPTDAVAAAPAQNSSATGAPTISGTAQVGSTLTADTSGIADEDGLTNAVFSYQWVADDEDIAGATGSSYTLTGDDEGKAITVTVSFTDAEGNPETLTSAPTGEVEAKPNTSATGVPTIDGTAQVGQTLTADTSGIDDEDGLNQVVFSYQWIRNDGNADEDIAGATGSSYTLTEDDEGKTVKVTVSFTDDAEGNPETLTSDPTAEVESQAGPLTGFTVVDAADTDQAVLWKHQTDGSKPEEGDTWKEWTDGGTLALGDPQNGRYGIRAETESDTGIHRVALELTLESTGEQRIDRTDDAAPYSLYGDEGEDALHGENLPVGSYTLKATAYTEDGEILGSLEISFTVALAKPGKPQDLEGEASAQRIELVWKAPAGSVVVEYVVYRGTLQNGSMNGQALTKYATIDAAGKAMTYTDDNVEEGVEYRYRVAAVNSSGEGKKSNWLDIAAE